MRGIVIATATVRFTRCIIAQPRSQTFGILSLRLGEYSRGSCNNSPIALDSDNHRLIRLSALPSCCHPGQHWRPLHRNVKATLARCRLKILGVQYQMRWCSFVIKSPRICNNVEGILVLRFGGNSCSTIHSLHKWHLPRCAPKTALVSTATGSIWFE